MQVQQRAAVEIVLARGEHQPLGRRAPAEAVIALEPHARPPVQAGDGGGDLALDEVGVAAGRVVAGRGVPARRAEVVAELVRLQAASAGVAGEDQPARGVPVVDRLEVTFLHQRHAHVGVVHPHLGRDRAEVGPQRRQHLEEIVALAPLELGGEVVVPDPRAGADVQLVVEEVVQSFGRPVGRGVLEPLVEVADDHVPDARQQRIERVGLPFGPNEPQLPFALRAPSTRADRRAMLGIKSTPPRCTWPSSTG